MKEVSCRALDVFFRELRRRKLPPDLLVTNTGYSIAELQDKHARIEWNAYLAVVENARKIWTTDEEIFDLGVRMLRTPFVRVFVIIGRLLFSPRDFYRWMFAAGTGFGNQMFSCITPSIAEDRDQDRHLTVALTMAPGYRSSPEFFWITRAGLTYLPTLLGLPCARVEMQFDERHAVYDITYPPGGSAVGWLRRVLMRPFTMLAAARELKAAQEVMQLRYLELEDARGELASQKTKLEIANTISQLIHRDLDVERTIQAVADALVSVGGFAGADVYVATRADGKTTEHDAKSGAAGESDPLCGVLESRGNSLGDVRVWHRPSEDARERQELLDFIMPTLSMAIDNAFSYRELLDYRRDLELKVHERTQELSEARDTLAQSVRRLEELQQSRDRIFANINHEIRSPLTLVQLAVAALKTRNAALFDPRSLQELDGIEMSTRRLLRLVDDLLLLAAGHEGKLTLRVDHVDLVKLCAAEVAAWRPAAERKKIQLGFVGPRACLRNVDQEKIERVLANLISNALKFTPSGGSVQVELDHSPRGVEILVRDTGIGIDEELKTRLFGRFEQGRPALHYGARGSGIGLSIVKELTEAHGGDVSVDSPRGGGSVFRVLLPTNAVPRAPLAMDAIDQSGEPERLRPDAFDSGRLAALLPRVMQPDGPARATILVAEDDPLLAGALGRLLSSEYRVLIAGDGLSALRLAQQHLPDLLVSDVGMPGMDGLELTRRFRMLPGNRLAPTVLLTAATTLKERLAGFDAGAVDYVHKPFDPPELMARIGSLLQLRSLALQLHQSEKLAALGTLSAGLAHEMRNPANAIVNAIEPLRELMPAELREPEHPVAQLIDVLQECSAQIALLSRQLLGFRREGELEYQKMTVTELLGRVRALTSPLFDKVTLREELEYKGDLECAGPLVTQALANIFANGAQAAGSGGWVQLSTRRRDDWLVVDVADSGSGVPVELRERIFEPFFTTKSPGAGTGLGLTMTRQIIERHGGSIDVREIPGGTKFHVELPLYARARRAQHKQGA